ncbi:hypothetical protein ACH0CP_15910 [Sphingomonas sp. 179-I 2A4 NHS]|uniref:hypothetical protein n=1 Tax=unclassified Sphingomonas TaxID=196159 RepID=UPI003879D7E3
MSDNVQSVGDLPFVDRRYIAVLSDEDFDRKKAKSPAAKYGEVILEAIPLVVPGGLLVRAGATIAAKVSAEWVRSRSAAQADGIHNRSIIQAIPLRESSRFMFLGGCAEVGKAYAANPLDDRTYYSVETYNDDMIDHKLSELERILNALGARSYNIIFKSDETTEASGAGGLKKSAKVKAEIELRNARAKRYERSGTSLGRDPVLPPRLAWLNREPSWQALVESRLEHGRQEFALRVNLERDLQISGKINADFKLLGLDVGADFKKKINFTLSVEGTFGG